MRSLVIVILSFSFVVPAAGFIATYQQQPLAASFSQYLGVASLIVMAWCFVLAVKNRLIERWVSGLDKLYLLHKWLGIGALALAFLHNQIDPLIGAEEESGLAEFGSSLGGTSFDILQYLLLLSVITIVPYALWKFTHRFIGLLYILAVLHFVLVTKPYSLSEPLYLYGLFWGVLGVLCFAYSQAVHVWLARELPYTVSKVVAGEGFTELTLTPEGSALSYSAGQFTFISFDHPKLKEPHPFTVSGPPNNDGRLRFTIKQSGDFTRDLASVVEAGMSAKIGKAYGQFFRFKRNKPQLWIAAGVGITPFSAMAGALNQDSPSTRLIFAARSKETAPHLAELESLAATNEKFELELMLSAEGQRLSAQHLLALPDIERYQIKFCGPAALRQQLTQALPQKVDFEAFEFRSGIAVLTPNANRLICWLAERFPVLREWWVKLDSQLLSKLY